MRVLSSVTILTLVFGGAAAASGSPGNLVDGSTTVAQVEQDLGAPMDTSMQPDGALTLAYPASRVPRFAGQATAGRTVYLHFGTDFVLRHITGTASATRRAAIGFASK